MARDEDILKTEELLADSGWIRRLAVNLVGNDADADDLVQETWLAALINRPSSETSLRPWLARVLRNLKLLKHRGQSRSLVRDTTFEVERDLPPSPEQLVERAEVVSQLARLVVELPEPYRSTILLHYYEGRSAEEIARHQKVPAGTVRARISRGLDQLRANLDRINGQKRSAWATALAAVGGARPRGVIWKGALAMKATLTVGTVLVVLLLGLVINRGLHRGNSSGEPTIQMGASRSHVAKRAQSIATFDPAAFSWLHQAGVPVHRIAGRVTFEGAPVANAEVRLVNPHTMMGAPEPTRKTDQLGRFDFGEQPPLPTTINASAPRRTAASLTLDINNPTLNPPADRLEIQLGPCDASIFGRVEDASGGAISRAHIRRRNQKGVRGGPGVEADDQGHYEMCVPDGGAPIQVDAAGYGGIEVFVTAHGRNRQDFTLVPEGIVVGRVVDDSSGARVPNAMVWLTPAEFAPNTWPASVSTASDASGNFQLAGIAPGRHRVGVYADGGVAQPTLVVIEPGKTVPIVCRVTSTTSARLSGVVMERGKPVAGATIRTAGLPFVITQADGSFTMGVAKGEVPLAIADYEVISPKTVDVKGQDIKGLKVEVASLAMIRGIVRRGGHAVANAMVHVEDRPRLPIHTGPDGTFELRGLNPGSYPVWAETLDARSERTTVEIAKGGIRDHVDFDLTRVGAISGIVANERGQPVDRAWVGVKMLDGKDEGSTTTAHDGTFRISQLAGAGDYRPIVKLQSPAGPALPPKEAGFSDISLRDGSNRVDGVRLVVQYEPLSISGKVISKAGAAKPDIRVIAIRTRPGDDPRFFLWNDLRAATTAVDGSFRMDGLPAGSYALRAFDPTGGEALLRDVAAGSSSVTITLDPGGGIDGALVGFTQSPTVTVAAIDRLPRFEIPVELEGSTFKIGGLPPGLYRVSGSNDTESDVTSVQVESGSTATVKLQSHGSGTATVNVQVAEFISNKPVEGVDCHASLRIGRQRWSQQLTADETSGPDGSARLTVPPGRITIECTGPEGKPFTSGVSQVSVASGQTIAARVIVVGERPDQRPAKIGAGFDLTFDGARIARIEPQGPADQVGLRTGDEFVAIDGRPIGELTFDGAMTFLLERPAGAKVPVSVLRGAETLNVVVTLASGN